LTFERVKEEIRPFVIKEKKADILVKKINDAKNLGSRKAELVVPADFLVASSFKSTKGKVKEIGDIGPKDIIVDVGPIATKVFCDLI